MLDNIKEIADRLKHAQSNDIEIVLRDYANNIIDECAKRVTLTDFASEFLQEGSGDAIDLYSILDIKKEI
jgi:hypothetical protein